MPYFDAETRNNVTVVVGKSAFLRCKVRNLGNKTVTTLKLLNLTHLKNHKPIYGGIKTILFQLAWIRDRDTHILTVGSYTYTTDQRFQAVYNKDGGESVLEIKWASIRDAGLYECQISSQPVRSLHVNLNVVLPTAVIWGAPEIFVDRGTMINITCTINYSNEPPAYIFWYHQDEVSDFVQSID